MDGELVTDLILRAVAAMRERGELPEVENPRLTVTRVSNARFPTYRSNAGAALFAAHEGDQPTATEFADVIAGYLQEVVDLVPAYSEITSVTTEPDGAITITLR